MFERYTDRARRVIVLAQEEARLLNHNYIGTEHILLGLIHEGEGVAALALESEQVSLDEVREGVKEIVGAGQSPPSGHIPFTPRAKKVLELALREALQLGHNYIGTEHILLGVVREGEGVGAMVLGRLGVELGTIRHTVVKILSGFKDYKPATLESRNYYRCVCGWERYGAKNELTREKRPFQEMYDHQETCPAYQRFREQGEIGTKMLMEAAEMLGLEPEAFIHKARYEKEQRSA